MLIRAPHPAGESLSYWFGYRPRSGQEPEFTGLVRLARPAPWTASTAPTWRSAMQGRSCPREPTASRSVRRGLPSALAGDRQRLTRGGHAAAPKRNSAFHDRGTSRLADESVFRDLILRPFRSGHVRHLAHRLSGASAISCRGSRRPKTFNFTHLCRYSRAEVEVFRARECLGLRASSK